MITILYEIPIITKKNVIRIFFIKNDIQYVIFFFCIKNVVTNNVLFHACGHEFIWRKFDLDEIIQFVYHIYSPTKINNHGN
jgi:hypothetical protein